MMVDSCCCCGWQCDDDGGGGGQWLLLIEKKNNQCTLNWLNWVGYQLKNFYYYSMVYVICIFVVVIHWFNTLLSAQSVDSAE